MENPLLVLPEIIGYLSGSALCLAAWIAHSISLRNNQLLNTLQLNLAKVGLVWFSENDSLIELRESTLDYMRKRRLRNRIITISGFVLFSWFGFFISLIMIYSLRRVQSPKERFLLRSALATRSNLNSQEANEELQLFRNEFSSSAQ